MSVKRPNYLVDICFNSVAGKVLLCRDPSCMFAEEKTVINSDHRWLVYPEDQWQNTYTHDLCTILNMQCNIDTIYVAVNLTLFFELCNEDLKNTTNFITDGLVV